MNPAAAQARDAPTELTVDRVAAALQELWQHLEHSQKDLVMCAQCTQESCPAAGQAESQCQAGASPCRGVGSLPGEAGGSQSHRPFCPAALSRLGYFCLSVCSPLSPASSGPGR